MQTLEKNKNVHKLKIKKSWLFLIGSLLVILGVVCLSYNHIMILKEQVFSDMKIKLSNLDNSKQEITEEVENVPVVENATATDEVKEEVPKETVNFDNYLGVLEIPRISLKRGFYGLDSKYNDVEYNVTLVKGSRMPDVPRGNLILMAHSGDAYISFFAYLYLLKIGDKAYVTYNGVKYTYKIVNIYNVPKTGTVEIIRNYDATTLTLITCTKDDDTQQTVYIAELVS